MEQIKKVISEAVKAAVDADIEPVLLRPEPEFGDISTNVAMQLAKQLGQNPRAIAEKIVEQLDSNALVTKVDVAGPGFINLVLADSFLLQAAQFQDTLKPYQNQTVVIETNNPNPFKAMHIGHGFNAIVADTIANLLEAGGAVTHRVSYHGDVGLHVGKSMYSLLRYAQGDIERIQAIPERERNGFMSKMYAEGARAYKEDNHAKAAIDDLTKQSFSLTDPLYKKIYELCKQWSFEQIDELVSALGNKPIEKRYLESQADPIGVSIVKAHVGRVFVESDRALLFPGSKYGSFDNVYVSSQGLGLYGARDLGLLELKNKDFNPDKNYIVTAEEQKDYFKGVIAATELINPEQKDKLINISTGTVKLTTGKMSSRSGDVVEVSWLFEQIEAAIKQHTDKPQPDVVKAAIRYQFLRHRIGSDIVFDIDEAASVQGNSGPYLQYAHARACSILAKSHGNMVTNPVLEPEEHTLLMKVADYSEAANRAIVELMPHHICTYLYDLTQAFNRFYEHNRVIGHEREAIRTQLIACYRDTLRAGLELLGIPAPEKM